MAIDKKDDKNLLFNQIVDEGKLHLEELVPSVVGDTGFRILNWVDDPQWQYLKGSDKIFLTLDEDNNLVIDSSIDYFEGTEMYFSDGKVGIGRLPLHNYKVDIGVPVDTRMTALHIGDGTFGFSLGNATDTGFLPQIIGLGSDTDDAGLYFLGKVSSSEGSTTPAIIFDGRDILNNPLENRPIMGISSGSYSTYKFLIDASGNTIIDGDVNANNITILEQEIQDLKDLIIILQNEDASLKERIIALETADSSA